MKKPPRDNRTPPARPGRPSAGGWPRRVRETATATALDAAVARMSARPGILDTLTPEDVAFIQAAAGEQPEVLGRTPRRRG
ncbi:MAG: hypothetical protein AB1941_22755 [Gemmatimonadota bacterium]